MTYQQIIKKIKASYNKKNVEGMARFGIDVKKAYGMPMPALRKLGKEIDKDHKLALQLWKSGIHEARILASLVDEPEKVTASQMDSWVKDFDSWDVCDQCCMNLFDRTPHTYKKAIAWSRRKEEFVKRAGYALMAVLAFHDKDASDSAFNRFWPAIKRGATDERNFVKKAVNWALRQLGKRRKSLNKKAIQVAKEIQKMDNKTAKWIANDALRELESAAVQKRLK